MGSAKTAFDKPLVTQDVAACEHERNDAVLVQELHKINQVLTRFGLQAGAFSGIGDPLRRLTPAENSHTSQTEIFGLKDRLLDAPEGNLLAAPCVNLPFHCEAVRATEKATVSEVHVEVQEAVIGFSFPNDLVGFVPTLHVVLESLAKRNPVQERAPYSLPEQSRLRNYIAKRDVAKRLQYLAGT